MRAPAASPDGGCGGPKRQAPGKQEVPAGLGLAGLASALAASEGAFLTNVSLRSCSVPKQLISEQSLL